MKATQLIDNPAVPPLISRGFHSLTYTDNIFLMLFHPSFRGVFTAEGQGLISRCTLFHPSFRGDFTAGDLFINAANVAVPPLISRGFHSGSHRGG